MRLHTRRLCLLPLLVGAASVAGCADETGPLETTTGEIINGTVTTARPEVGQMVTAMGNCTATLISQRYFITAAHCVGYAARATGGTFTINLPPAPGVVPTVTYGIDAVYSFNGNSLQPFANPCPPAPASCVSPNGIGAYDIAVGRLTTDVPAATATPALLGGRLPIFGETVTQMGYGCNQKQPALAGFGTKRTRSYVYGTNDVGCSGDSGGPIFLGNLNQSGAIAALFSSFNASNGTRDGHAFPTRLKARVEALMRSLDLGTRDPFEAQTDRPGSDFQVVTTNSIMVCRSLCSGLPNCKAFSMTGTNCFLKSDAPLPVANANVTSGVMQRGMELGLDRPGADMTSFTGSTAARCRQECAQRGDCHAFTFVTGTSTCFIKGAAQGPVPNSGTISGLNLSQAPYDLFGGDLANMPLLNHTADTCLEACAQNARCAAYTFDRSFAGCYLKGSVPAASSCPHCVSGIKKALEVNFDRSGSDPTGPFPQPVFAVSTCQRLCYALSTCQAFSFRPATSQCFLKESVGQAVPAPGVTSGIRRGIQVNVDRVGSNLSFIDIADPVPEVCQISCEANANCRAWTLVTRPTGRFNGTVNRCFLKNGIPSPSTAIGVFSGVKGGHLF